MLKNRGKRLDPSRILEKAVDVATFYGFRPYTEILEPLKVVTNARPVCIPVDKVRYIDTGKKQGSVMETYLRNEGIRREDPKLLYFYTQQRTKEKESSASGRFNLEIFGLNKSIGEAMIIRACLSILEEVGHTNMSVAINSIGDRESLARFSREYSSYYKRRGLELHAQCRENLKKSFWKMFSCRNDRCVSIREEAPQSIGYLSEASRQHFREVLEFLEVMQAPYEIDNNLMRDTDKFCETIFEIRHIIPFVDKADTPISEVLAHGGRYNYLARRIGGKKDIPAVGISISLEAASNPEKSLHRSKKKPRVYFIQLGYDAMRKSFPVLEILRKTSIPLLQSHGANQLMGQLSIAEKLAIPYTMIMGQREAVDGTVIMRNTASRKQETIPITELSAHLERLTW